MRKGNQPINCIVSIFIASFLLITQLSAQTKNDNPFHRPVPEEISYMEWKKIQKRSSTYLSDVSVWLKDGGTHDGYMVSYSEDSLWIHFGDELFNGYFYPEDYVHPWLHSKTLYPCHNDFKKLFQIITGEFLPCLVGVILHLART